MNLKFVYLIVCFALFVFYFHELVSMLFVPMTILQFRSIEQQNHRKLIFCIRADSDVLKAGKTKKFYFLKWLI